jgi:hypothetical protein
MYNVCLAELQDTSDVTDAKALKRVSSARAQPPDEAAK